MLISPPEPIAAQPIDSSPEIARQIVDLMLSIMADGLDHPELWAMIPGFVATQPMLLPILEGEAIIAHDDAPGRAARLLLGLCLAQVGDVDAVIDALAPIAADHSQSPLVQGVLFHLNGLADPDNPKYTLAGKICEIPFREMDVLERSTHLCCASWLPTSAGDLSATDWPDVWNSDTAQAIRASIHDGSYRYCNKGACPKIQSNALLPTDTLAARSAGWSDIVTGAMTALPVGPEVVNLAYDRTCNLSCPSCRTDRFAADDATRLRFSEMQERAILPLLATARTVFITGSGDPFTSKNFRQLMHQLTPAAYPDLRFRIMTNGMLFTPAQWESFPSLHGRVATLKISIDAATGPTHERLRRGARWPVMLDNMAFAGDLMAQGLIDGFELVFTVQTDNYCEMGDAVDLAHRVGANGINFLRLTNWGTFTAAQYRDRAVFLPFHPDHHDFQARMHDPRLQDPIVLLGDLESFLPDGATCQRKYVC